MIEAERIFITNIYDEYMSKYMHDLQYISDAKVILQKQWKDFTVYTYLINTKEV